MNRFLLLAFLPFALIASEEEASFLAKRSFAYLKLEEVKEGVVKTKEALQRYPTHAALQEGLIRLLAKGEMEEECLKAWSHYQDSFQDSTSRRELLEEVSWCAIRKGIHSSMLLARVVGLIGAAMTQDAYANSLLEEALEDSNSIIRSLAVELAANYMDGKLNEKLLWMIEHETVAEVRLRAIDAVAQMQLTKAASVLKKRLPQVEGRHVEKAAVVAALATLCKDVAFDEIKELTGEMRCGFRLLACRLAREQTPKCCIELLLPLLHDSNAEVRTEVMTTFGLAPLAKSDRENLLPHIKESLDDPDFKVAITAAWLLTLWGDEWGRERLVAWCMHSTLDVRRLATAALCVSGEKGALAMQRQLQVARDPFQRASLAFALLGLRESVDIACDELFHFLSHEPALLMEDNSLHPLFAPLVPTKLHNMVDEESHSPRAVDLSIRLSLLRTLAILKDPRTLDAIKQFLKEREFGVSGIAAATLIEEGGSDGLEVVRQLLYDPELKIRVQAALVLGMWSKDKETVRVLQESYPLVDRELKIRILETVGRIGDPSSTDFLLQTMQDPYLVIRVISGAALILCLNH